VCLMGHLDKRTAFTCGAGIASQIFISTNFHQIVNRNGFLVEHLGRTSGQPRYVVLEVIEREANAIRVASGYGTRAQWLKNLAAHPTARLWVGHSKGVPATSRILPDSDAAAVLARYARVHPDAWEHLTAAMGELNGADATIPVVEFTPPTR